MAPCRIGNQVAAEGRAVVIFQRLGVALHQRPRGNRFDCRGPSIEAELDGSYIVFPLGPALKLSWASCTEKQNPDASKLYSCELKPGYRFQ